MILNHKIQCSGHGETLQCPVPVESPFDLIGLGSRADTRIPPLEPSVPLSRLMATFSIQQGRQVKTLSLQTRQQGKGEGKDHLRSR